MFAPLWPATSIGRVTLGFNNLSFISWAHYAVIYDCLSSSTLLLLSVQILTVLIAQVFLPAYQAPQFCPLSWLVIFRCGSASFLIWTGHESIRIHCLSAAPAFPLSSLSQPGYLPFSICWLCPVAPKQSEPFSVTLSFGDMHHLKVCPCLLSFSTWVSFLYFLKLPLQTLMPPALQELQRPPPMI